MPYPLPAPHRTGIARPFLTIVQCYPFTCALVRAYIVILAYKKEAIA